jgi:hypothetical protein
VKLLINGEFVDSKTSKWVDVVCPVRSGRERVLRWFVTAARVALSL